MPYSFSSGSSRDDCDGSSSSETYFWGCSLSKSRPSVQWNYDDDDDSESHSLNLKQAVLGVGAVNNERNVIQVETTNFSNEQIHIPLLSLTLGRNDMCSLDICFDSSDPVTFRLIEGTGPVHLIAEHIVEIDDDDDDDDDDDESDSDDNIFYNRRRSAAKKPQISVTKPTSRRSVDAVTSSSICCKLQKIPEQSTKARNAKAKKSPTAKQITKRMTKTKTKPTTKKPSTKPPTTTTKRTTTAKKPTSKEVKPVVDRRKSWSCTTGCGL